MEFETIVYETGEGIGWIRRNRPNVLNAMNRKMWLDIQSALTAAQGDVDMRVLVFTGNGRAFSTGADLKEATNN